MYANLEIFFTALLGLATVSILGFVGLVLKNLFKGQK